MPQYINPYSASRRWLKGNIHAHTCCGPYCDLADSGRAYAMLRYAFLAVTDHNKTHDPRQIEQWSQQAGLVVIPGEENGQTDHMIELGVHDVTPTPDNGAYADRAQALRDAGGFVFGCHPQEYPHGHDNIRQGVGRLHAVEIYNGMREFRGSDEFRNVALWDELLSEGARLWAVATDDFHAHTATPGNGWVQVQAPEDADTITWPLIVEQLKRGAFYASTSPRLESFTLTDRALEVEACTRAKSMRVIGPGGQVLHEQPGRHLQWQVVGGLPYFRVEAICGIKRAWSQPFYAA